MQEELVAVEIPTERRRSRQEEDVMERSIRQCRDEEMLVSCGKRSREEDKIVRELRQRSGSIIGWEEDREISVESEEEDSMSFPDDRQGVD